MPSTDLATQAVQVAVGGRNNRVVVAVAQSGGEAVSSSAPEQESEPPDWRRWAKIDAAIVGLAGIVAAVFQVLQYLDR